MQDSRNTSRRPVWNYVGLDGVQGTNTASGTNDDNIAQFMQGNRAYTVFNNSGVWPDLPAVDYDKAYKFFQDNPNLFKAVGTSVSADPSFNDITENVYAAYVQGRIETGKLTTLTGVRFEKTKVEASGQYTDPRNPTNARVNRSSSYDDFFPSIHFRYDFTTKLVAHASVSTGAARPNKSDLYPTTSISYNDATGLGTVTQNDAGLKPQTSTNYDVSLEYYFEPAGVISIGWFRKDIKDFLARSSEIIDGGPDNGFGGDFAGYTLNTTSNQGEAKIQGFEANYNQQLTMLPAPFNGIRLFANYTDLDASGTFANNATDLVKFIPKTGNAGFSFLWRDFEFRASYRYTGSYLSSLNANPNQQQRTLAVETYDLNFQYRFSPKFALFLDVINVTDKWPEFYTGSDPRRIVISDIYGTRLNMGITGRF